MKIFDFKTIQPSPPDDSQLSAFADGELSRRQARQVAAFIRQHPEAASRVHDYWQQEAVLIKAFKASYSDDTAVEPIAPGFYIPRWVWGATSLVMASCIAVIVTLTLTGLPAPDKPLLAKNILKIFNGISTYIEPGTKNISPIKGLGLTFTGHKRVKLNHYQLMEYRYIDQNGRPLALYRMSRTNDTNEHWMRLLLKGRTPMARWSQGTYSYILVGSEPKLILTQHALNIRQQMLSDNGTPNTINPTINGLQQNNMNQQPINGQDIPALEPNTTIRAGS